MLIDKYLVIEARKGRYYGALSTHVRLVERVPTLSGNEIALRIKINIPDALFKRPTVTAEMTIPDTAVPTIDITPEITTNIEEIIKQRTGLDMVISIVPYKEPTSENEE